MAPSRSVRRRQISAHHIPRHADHARLRIVRRRGRNTDPCGRPRNRNGLPDASASRPKPAGGAFADHRHRGVRFRFVVRKRPPSQNGDAEHRKVSRRNEVVPSPHRRLAARGHKGHACGRCRRAARARPRNRLHPGRRRTDARAALAWYFSAILTSQTPFKSRPIVRAVTRCWLRSTIAVTISSSEHTATCVASSTLRSRAGR